jgi:hypothetical protein
MQRGNLVSFSGLTCLLEFKSSSKIELCQVVIKEETCFSLFKLGKRDNRKTRQKYTKKSNK